MKFIPNMLTILRLVLSFCLIPVVLNGNSFWILLVFGVASASDFFDGYIARKFSVCSRLGAALDPLADKVFMINSYVLFAVLHFIPIYVSVVVVTRDILILLVVVACKLRNVSLEIKPIMASKINTAIQLFFLICVVVYRCVDVYVPYFIDILSAIVSASTVFSGVEYARKYFWIKHALFNH